VRGGDGEGERGVAEAIRREVVVIKESEPRGEAIGREVVKVRESEPRGEAIG
jgi:hypothetical protein